MTGARFDAVRATAFEVLRAVDDRDAYVNLLLPGLLRERGIVGRDAAFATELVHGTERWRGSYDWIIDQLVKRPLDPPVRDALRLGAHQLLNMRVPTHAAVSTTVDMVRRNVGHKPAGFVNAVLRRISEKTADEWLVDAPLSAQTSHPQWIIDALTEALGSDVRPLLDANNAPPKVTLVARPGLVSPGDLPGSPGRLSPYARILDGGDPADIPAVTDGRAGVQDEGSQVVAIELAEAEIDGPDARWLDLCAGPGGKSALLGAMAAQRGATLVANEVQPHRAELVRQAVTRLANVEVTTYDGREGPWEPQSFDRVLVDAPCTGLGALRRRPEARWRRRPEDLDELVPLQVALLMRALELVRPGGVVAYATCSPHVAETHGVLNAVGVEPMSTRQLWPHLDGTDAMFVALTSSRKDASRPASS